MEETLNKPRSIFFDARWIRSRQLDGIGRFTLQLLKALLELDKVNRYTVGFSNDALRDFVMSQIPAASGAETVVLGWDLFSPREIIAYPAFLKRRQFDIVFAPNWLSYPFGGGSKTVLMVHDLIPFLLPYVRTTWKWKVFYAAKFPFRHLLKRAAKVVVNSDHTLRDVVGYFSIRQEQLVRLYEGVDDKFYQTVPDDRLTEIRSRYHLPARFVLCVSRQQPYKNLAGLARAYLRLPETLQAEYPLVLVGERHPLYEQELGVSFAALEQQQRVIFTGHVADDELPGIYQMASLLVLPSTYEGFGLPVLEAQASGTPVAVSRAASLPEVAGEGAVYFDPQDPRDMAKVLENILNDESSRKKLAALGRQNARRFTWEQTAAGLMEIINGL